MPGFFTSSGFPISFLQPDSKNIAETAFRCCRTNRNRQNPGRATAVIRVKKGSGSFIHRQLNDPGPFSHTLHLVLENAEPFSRGRHAKAFKKTPYPIREQLKTHIKARIDDNPTYPSGIWRSKSHASLRTRLFTRPENTIARELSVKAAAIGTPFRSNKRGNKPGMPGWTSSTLAINK